MDYLFTTERRINSHHNDATRSNSFIIIIYFFFTIVWMKQINMSDERYGTEQVSNITWCRLAGSTISWVAWAGGVFALAVVGGLLLPPAANRAAVAMTMSPRIHLPTVTQKRSMYYTLRKIISQIFVTLQLIYKYTNVHCVQDEVINIYN